MRNVPAGAVDRARVLLIDDDRRSCALLAERLGSAGYDVHEAPDGEAGLEATRSLEPDLVLCEWALPRLGGVEYCRTVKEDPYLRGTYVTLLAERADRDGLVVGLDAGADDYLVKPVDAEELMARVRVGLRSRQLQRELSSAQYRAALIEMASTLGQEINNPLTALFGHLELMLQYIDRGDPSRMQHHLRQAGDAAGRIAEVAQSLTALRERRSGETVGGIRWAKAR